MTFAQKGGGVKKYPKFADKQYIKFRQRGREGFKKSENFADVINGSPLGLGGYAAHRLLCYYGVRIEICGVPGAATEPPRHEKFTE